MGDVEDGSTRENETETQQVYGDIVLCELLCFAQFYLDCSTPENVRHIILGHFTEDEILNAKKVLWDENNKPHLPKYADRRTTPTRSAAEANLDDIMLALSTIDKLVDPDYKRTKYAAFNWKRMPTQRPEELNQTSMLRRICELEKKFHVLENNLSENHIEFSDLRTNVDTMSQNIATQAKLIEEVAQPKSKEKSKDDRTDVGADKADEEGSTTNTSDETDSSTDDGVSSDEADDEVDDEKEDDEPSRSVVSEKERKTSRHLKKKGNGKPKVRSSERSVHPLSRTLHRTIRDKEKRAQSSQKRSWSSALKDRPTVNGSALGGIGKWSGVQHVQSSMEMPRTDRNGFMLPRYNWKKQNRHNDVFIFNVPKSVKTDDVKRFVAQKHVTVTDLLQRSHPEARRKSFVLRVPSSQARKVMTASFWPLSIKVREYTSRD